MAAPIRQARGLELPQTKLNETLVKKMRAQHAIKEEAKRILDAQFSARAFARRYNVSQSTIVKVLTYDSWRWVK